MVSCLGRMIALLGWVAFASILACPVLDARPVHAASLPAVSPCLPSEAQLSAGFDLAGVGRLGSGYPHLPRIGVDGAMVPPVILKAIAWMESNWQQFDSESLPLISPDFGYGVMQITSGMAGASGTLGSIPIATQSRIGGDYLYNVAYGARMLAQLFNELPAINNGDPTRLEDWYYAIWAYNGWGAVNNPNNPSFSRQGTPATEPDNFPYQERVYYLVQHPPLDIYGRPLWQPMKVTMPNPSMIGSDPGAITIRPTHQELPHLYGATYTIPHALMQMSEGETLTVPVTVYNSSGVPWTKVGGQAAFGLMYHWVKPASPANPNYDPHLHGVDVLDGAVTPLQMSLAIGAAASVAADLAAPEKPGVYRLEWDMWGRSAGWFSYSSVPPGIQTVTVEPASVTPQPYVPEPAAPHFQGNHAELVTTLASDTPNVMTADEPYSRTVLLFNPGGATWNQEYTMDLMGTGKEQTLPLASVPACRIVPVTISGTAPSTPGKYTQRWRMTSASDQAFGPVISFSFSVVSGK